MSFVNLGFRVHVPLRLRSYSSMDVGVSKCYFDWKGSLKHVDALADQCFLPAARLLLTLVDRYKGRFRIAFSISGTTLELLQDRRNDVIELLRELSGTGCVEFYGEPYHHTLSSMYSTPEFTEQVRMHKAAIQEMFDAETAVFRNTELIHQNRIAATVAQLNFRAMFCEGVDRLLKGGSVNSVYSAPGAGTLKILLRNHHLSDDLAFRFGDERWSEFPLTAEKYASWIHAHGEQAQAINLFFDFATIGVHKKKTTGIFEFMEAFPGAVMADDRFSFATPSEISDRLASSGTYDVRETISWKDAGGEGADWCANMMLNNMARKIYSLEQMVKSTDDGAVLNTWRKLQLADYFYHMSSAETSENYRLSNPFCSAEEAYRNYLNIVTDFEIMLIRRDIDRLRKRKRQVHMSFII